MNVSKNPTFQAFLLVLSIFVVIELYVGTVVIYSPLTQNIINWVDLIICSFFLFGFTNGLYQANNKWKYFKKNWIDLVSSIPVMLLPDFGVLRAGRIVRIIKILRVVRSAKYIFSFFNSKSSFRTFRNLFLVSGLIIFLFSLSFYQLEKDANPYINSFGDSLWWTTITTITVGFLQDLPPVTVEGKFFSVALILLGMIMFSTLTGTITDYFIEDEDIQKNIDKLNKHITVLESKLDEVSEKLDKLNDKI